MILNTIYDKRFAILFTQHLRKVPTAYPDGRIVEKPQAGVERQVIDGVLGHQFFTHFVVEIDYARQQINVYDRASYKYSGAGEIIPLEIALQSHIRARTDYSTRPHSIRWAIYDRQ